MRFAEDFQQSMVHWEGRVAKTGLGPRFAQPFKGVAKGIRTLRCRPRREGGLPNGQHARLKFSVDPRFDEDGCEKDRHISPLRSE